MNKRTRFIVSLLFIVIIILAAAITHFYVDVPENMNDDSAQGEIVQTVENDSSGNSVFRDGKGNFGISNGKRVTAAPEWQNLQFAGKGVCIATKKLGGRLLSGCIDYDGNVIIPFIYSGISRHVIEKNVIYCAECESDGQFVLYDENFEPLMRRSWNECIFEENLLTVTDDSGIYVFSVSQYGIIFKSAAVTGEVVGNPYSISVSSRVLLSKLSVPMIEKMADGAEKYLEYACSFDENLLSDFEPETRTAFIPAFADDPRIISRKLLGISEVRIYSVSSDDGIPKYDISMRADMEIIYYDESGEKKSLDDNYRLSVKFSGSSESNFHAVSGKFELDSPVYPEPEPIEEEEQEETENENIFMNGVF